MCENNRPRHPARCGTAAADPRGAVQSGWRRQDAIVSFVVEDDGPGISPDVRDRVFEPFFTTKAVGEGTGLGLAVVHGIAKEHDGDVAIETGTLGGARFNLRIPVPRRIASRSDDQIVEPS